MNMVRIRRIMEVRQKSKAPPLLPPKLKKSSFDSERRLADDIIDIHLQVREFRGFTADNVVCTIYESEGGRDGPWRLTASSDVVPMQNVLELPNVFSIEFMFEVPQPLRIELCSWTEDNVQSLGFTVFTVAEVINSRSVTKAIVNEATNECIAAVDVSCSIKHRAQPLAVQFQGRDFNKKLVADGNLVYFQVFHVTEDEQRTPVYRSEAIRSDKTGSPCQWRPFTLQLNEEDDLAMAHIEVLCLCRDDRTKQDTLVGRLLTSLGQLQKDTSSGNVYFLTNSLYKNGKKSVGTFEATRCTPIVSHTFLDYISTGVSLQLSFAIDFSSLEETECFTSAFVSDVEFVIRSISDCFRDYPQCRSIAAFGLGARVPPLHRESQQFPLNLETNPNCAGVEGVLEALRISLGQIRPATTAHLAHIIYYVAKMAQNGNLRKDGRNGPSYNVLVVMTRGDVDDMKEAVQAVIFASRTPLSIVFVGIGDGRMAELDRLGAAGMRLAFQGRKVARDILHFVDLKSVARSSIPTEEEQSSLSERALYRVPNQLAAFFMKNAITPEKKNSIDSSLSRPRLQSMQSIDSASQDYDDFFDQVSPSFGGPQQRSISSSGTSSPYFMSNESHSDDEFGFRGTSPTVNAAPYTRMGKRPMMHRLSGDLRTMSIQSGPSDGYSSPSQFRPRDYPV